MSGTIAIVIVNYNRRAMLEKTLEACLREPARRIFVVNNASTDGTREYLDELAGREPRVRPRHLGRNTGGAAGFAEGLRLAHGAGHEWFWLMDDDVEPVPGGLGTLLARAEEVGAPCCLYPAKLCADGRLFDFEYQISRRTLRRRRVSSLGPLAPGALVPSNSGNFEGAFLHRDVVGHIGLPDGRFFISWDDAFYGLRAAEDLPCYYFASVCLRKQVDKERLALGGKGYLSSTLFSRWHFLRNYWAVMRYLKARRELSPLAYVRYGYEFFKAAAITALIDRDPRGVGRLFQAAREGRKGTFTPWQGRS